MKKIFIFTFVALMNMNLVHAENFDCEDVNYGFSEGLKAKFSVSFDGDTGVAQVRLKTPLQLQTIVHTGKYKTERLSWFDVWSGGGQTQPQTYEVTHKKRVKLMEPSDLTGIVTVEGGQIVSRTGSLLVKLNPHKSFDNNWYLSDQKASIEFNDGSEKKVSEIFCRNYVTNRVSSQFEQILNGSIGSNP